MTAPAIDLTWAELNTAAGASVFSVNSVNNHVVADMALLASAANANLDSGGVFQAIDKLATIAYAAQATVNSGNTVQGTRLASIVTPAYGSPAVQPDGNSLVQVTRAVTTIQPVSDVLVTPVYV
jgi:hypothetical protein